MKLSYITIVICLTFILSYNQINQHFLNSKKGVNAEYSIFDIDTQSNNVKENKIDPTVGNVFIEHSPYEIQINALRIQYKDIVIFNNYELIFDDKMLSSNGIQFYLKDSNRYESIKNVIEVISTHYKSLTQNCRFMFTNNNDESLISFSQQYQLANDINSFMHLYLHLFCFDISQELQSFISQFKSSYLSFLSLSSNQNIFFFNKSKLSKLNIVYKSSKHNSQNEQSQYAYITFSKNGIVISDEVENKLNTIYDTINYNSIVNCQVDMIKSKTINYDSNQCCLNMKIDNKELYPSEINICSFKKSLEHCVIESKFIQNKIRSMCINSIMKIVDNAYENNKNIRVVLSQFDIYSKKFLFDFIKKYINNKIYFTRKTNLNAEETETKLLSLIADMGNDFKEYLHTNQANGYIGRIEEIIKPISELPNDLYQELIQSNQNKQNTLDNIFSICEKHPNMIKCLCAAFPLSQICYKEYCLLYPNSYQCNPSYCSNRDDTDENCICKYKPFDMKCKCLLNPINKDCFCLKYPNSVYCLNEFCNHQSNKE